jgi:hypothetical protein
MIGHTHTRHERTEPYQVREETSRSACKCSGCSASDESEISPNTTTATPLAVLGTSSGRKRNSLGSSAPNLPQLWTYPTHQCTHCTRRKYTLKHTRTSAPVNFGTREEDTRRGHQKRSISAREKRTPEEDTRRGHQKRTPRPFPFQGERGRDTCCDTPGGACFPTKSQLRMAPIPPAEQPVRIVSVARVNP